MMSRYKASIFIIFLSGLFMFNLSAIAAETNTELAVNNNDTTKIKHYEKSVDSYLRGLNEKNLEEILSLYADNATVEDPVGSDILSGIKALRKFYGGAVTIDLKLTRTGPVRVAGMEAAFPFQLQMLVNGILMQTDIIDVFRFNEAGKIVSMRAFWGPSNQKTIKE